MQEEKSTDRHDKLEAEMRAYHEEKDELLRKKGDSIRSFE